MPTSTHHQVKVNTFYNEVQFFFKTHLYSLYVEDVEDVDDKVELSSLVTSQDLFKKFF